MFVLIESLRVAWLSIAGNRLRTFLTMLGVVIGVAAVIALVSVGQGAQSMATAQIQSLGSNLVTVTTRGNAYMIQHPDLQELKARVPGIAYILPEVTEANQVVKSETTYTVTVQGTGAEYPQVRERGMMSGTWFTEEDVANRSGVAVLGPTAAASLFGEGVNPIGQTLRKAGYTYSVIGVAEPKGSGLAGDQDDIIFVPYTTLSRQMGFNRIPSLTIKAKTSQDSEAVTQLVSEYFAEKFRSDEAVRVRSMDELLEAVGSITQIFTLLLGAIASISLLVGGIGIMNIMLVSVSERTREIGIRKAIGAKNRDVLLQFLIESVILSGSGGAIGIVIGALGAFGLSKAMGFPATVTMGSVLLSFGFATTIGVVFGFYPAYRAAGLDPIEALRRD